MRNAHKVLQEAYEQVQQEGLMDTFRSNKSILKNMFKQQGFKEAYWDNEMGDDKLEKGMELHDDGTEGIVELIFFKDSVSWSVNEDGFGAGDRGNIDLSKNLKPADLQKIVDFIMHKVNRTDAPSPNSVEYKKWNADREARRLRNLRRPEPGEEWKG